MRCNPCTRSGLPFDMANLEKGSVKQYTLISTTGARVEQNEHLYLVLSRAYN